MIYLDFETKSLESIESGAYNYSKHPSTEAVLLSYLLPGKPIKTINFYDSIELPLDLGNAINSGMKIMAWNAHFEYYIFNHVCAVKYKWPQIPITQFIDAAAVGSRYCLPFGLDKACDAVGLSDADGKVTEGKRLIKIFACPDKDGYIFTDKDKPEEFKKYINYCEMDVMSMKAILDKLPTRTLQPQEQKHWVKDFIVNTRGISLDVRTITQAVKSMEILKTKYEKDIVKLTEGKVTTGNQLARMLDWIENHTKRPPDLTKETVERLIQDESTPPQVKKLLILRKALGKSSISKYQTMLKVVSADGRARGMFQFNGANKTSRWSGRGIQPHSLPRGNLKVPDKCIPLITKGEIQKLEKQVGAYPEVLSSAIRQMFVAAKGHKFLIADWSGIENRVTSWLADDQVALQRFRDNIDQYILMAAKVFHKLPSEISEFERFIGKQIILGCGFGMGGKTFSARMEQMGVKVSLSEADKYIKVYREANPAVIALWAGLEKAAIKAMVMGKGQYKNIIYFTKHGNLYCRLPNGKLLTYPRAKLKNNSWGKPEISYLENIFGRWRTTTTYGGKLLENVAQAISREGLAESIFRLEEKDYPVVLHVHDEIVCEVPIKSKHHTLQEMEDLMNLETDWNKGLPLATEGFESDRYRK